ncbi:RNA 2',3'-cyclic phosphodiesterase [Streptomyces polyrhachis]|uniref:RNA 2',3'-cyclic phosphodiesterase n=1 Tax=Streptomyces polyrhachis TaxID=1282885 RepID=A0ABW2GJT3_9ACTN
MTGEAAGPATVRVFIALAPPDAAKDELARALEPAYAAHPALRWNRIEDWHLTLAFLGEQPVGALAKLRPALGELAAGRPALELALRGGGHFDERVLWSGVTGEVEGLHGLAAQVREAVEGCGVVLPFPGRPLRPHLTLARARRDDTASVARAAASLAGFRGQAWRAGRLHLVGSNVGRGPGPIRYRDVDAWDFEGR